MTAESQGLGWHTGLEKEPSWRLLEGIASGEVEATADVEVFQEILHRYRSLGRWAEGKEVYDLSRQVILDPIPIDARLMDEERRLMDSYLDCDGIHAAAATFTTKGIICSFDCDFDAIAGITRLEPRAVRP
ncbi:MAG: PIN domain-containing protein [Cyanobacteria bacterium REEB65]|nr:PIN domain-containing protein [Cyanobacteria bacterium REEB65]